MSGADWFIVGLFFIASVLLGTCFTKRAGQSLESYFASERSLPWWLAGTSIAATAFSSDTPLLITGMIRRRGLWGIWEVLALAISSLMAVFIFAKLWKRAQVLTEVELVEARYSGAAAAWLRGFKAIYWGLLYNCFVIGAWPVTGLRKILETTTGMERVPAIVLGVAIAALYTSCSGMWGVVLTDLFQFVWAMVGAVLLAVFALQAVGGLEGLRAGFQADSSALHFMPPLSTDGASWIESPFGWFIGLLLIQWWAWKNSDGGGVVVQRIVSSKDERQAMASVLWFCIAHYCLRFWPWALAALATLILLPDVADHEATYPMLVMQVLPAGLRGVLIASFFAAFLSTVSSQLNWGGSYLINDFYKRFVRRDADEKHYIALSRGLTWVIALGAMGVAFYMQSIGQAFTWILHLTAGIGPVYLARWFWWRVNPWSEITAMLMSVPMLLVRPLVLDALGLPVGSITELLCMVIGTALVWVPVTLLTAPSERDLLARFYERVRPPGFWGPVVNRAEPIRGQHTLSGPRESWSKSLLQWTIATVAIVLSAIAPLQVLLHNDALSWISFGVAALAWAALWRTLRATGLGANADS
jgi:Na+/proline symporter